MKKIITIIFFLIISNLLISQIILENLYLNSFTFPFTQFSRDFGLVNLGGSNYKYYIVDNDSSRISLYNLNHSLYKNITIPVVGNDYHIAYISNSLFDCDSSTTEYLLTKAGATAPYYTRVYDENGSVLLNENNAIVTSCKWNCPNTMTTIVDQPFIYNTPSGTKMLLTYTNGFAKVFSLCGTLAVTSVRDLNNMNQNGLHLFNAYPNPSSNKTRIDYNLPNGVSQGKLLIFDAMGKLVKTYKVSEQFKYITVSTKELPAGTYYYSLQTASNITEGKKMIIIN
ncbi:MAG: hypothetical protein COA97_07325 [Flavobacteriales bacterium]|nr:MAG: hypothetical protein COA97_07325 [Flavobacteriales bacterium]